MPSFCIGLVRWPTNAWQKSWREQATQRLRWPQNQPNEERMGGTHPRKRQWLVVMHGTIATNSDNKASPCLAKLCSDHEIFNTKINNFTNLECFTKLLCLENLELYSNNKTCMGIIVIAWKNRIIIQYLSIIDTSLLYSFPLPSPYLPPFLPPPHFLPPPPSFLPPFPPSHVSGKSPPSVGEPACLWLPQPAAFWHSYSALLAGQPGAAPWGPTQPHWYVLVLTITPWRPTLPHCLVLVQTLTPLNSL